MTQSAAFWHGRFQTSLQQTDSVHLPVRSSIVHMSNCVNTSMMDDSTFSGIKVTKAELSMCLFKTHRTWDTECTCTHSLPQPRMQVSRQHIASATSPPPTVAPGTLWSAESVWTLWKIEKTHTSVWNRTLIPLSSSPWDSHCTDISLSR